MNNRLLKLRHISQTEVAIRRIQKELALLQFVIEHFTKKMTQIHL